MNKIFDRVDKFYVILALVLLIMTILFVFAIKGSLTLFLSSNEFDPTLLPPDVQVDKVKLEEAYNFAFGKETVRLEVR